MGILEGHVHADAHREGLHLDHPQVGGGCPEFKQKNSINGYDLADIYSKSIALAGEGGYMKYRTINVYPQVDQQIDKAIERIVSGQASARESMQKAQVDSIADLKKAGVDV